MGRRGWGRAVFLAVLAAAGAAAAQMGVGYGLGIIVWVPKRPDLADAAWAAGLAWTVFAAANSVVLGAVIGDRVTADVHSGRIVRTASRLTMVLASALGASITIPLVVVPTQQVRIVDNFAPHLVAGTYAAAGVMVGLLAAVLALPSRAVAANIFTTAGFLWVLAAVAVANAGGQSTVTQLGIWKFTSEGPVWHAYYIPGALLMLGGALMIGGLAAFPAAGRGEGRIGVSLSGAFGPLLLAASYALAAPRPGHATFEQLSAFYTSPYMIAAGFLGSALVGAVGAAPSRRPRMDLPATASSEARRSAAAPSAAPAAAATPAALLGRRSTSLPARSASGVSATASVPAPSRATPDEWRHP